MSTTSVTPAAAAARTPAFGTFGVFGQAGTVPSSETALADKMVANVNKRVAGIKRNRASEAETTFAIENTAQDDERLKKQLLENKATRKRLQETLAALQADIKKDDEILTLLHGYSAATVITREKVTTASGEAAVMVTLSK
jgi:hypothetical protein